MRKQLTICLRPNVVTVSDFICTGKQFCVQPRKRSLTESRLGHYPRLTLVIFGSLLALNLNIETLPEQNVVKSTGWRRILGFVKGANSFIKMTADMIFNEILFSPSMKLRQNQNKRHRGARMSGCRRDSELMLVLEFCCETKCSIEKKSRVTKCKLVHWACSNICICTKVNCMTPPFVTGNKYGSLSISMLHTKISTEC